MRVRFGHEPEGAFADSLSENLTGTVELVPEGDSAPVDVWVGGRPKAEDLSTSRPSAVVIPFAGLPVNTRTLLLEHPEIAVYNLHHNAEATAQMAWALLLAAARSVVPADRELRSHDWRRRYAPDPGVLLDGRRLLVIGWGRIGRRVGEFGRAFGMEVTGVRRVPSQEQGVIGVEELDGHLPHTDVVVVAAPATPATEGLLGCEQFAAMPKGGLVVNVGRASICDEDALYDALFTGHLAGAGLDVWYQYPESEEKRVGTAPSRFLFEKLDSVVLSPHRAGHASDIEPRRGRELAAVLNALDRGEGIPRPVDVDAGY